MSKTYHVETPKGVKVHTNVKDIEVTEDNALIVTSNTGATKAAYNKDEWKKVVKE